MDQGRAEKMKGGKQKIGKPGAGSLETFLTTDGIRMGTGWDQDIGGKDEMGKVENREPLTSDL